MQPRGSLGAPLAGWWQRKWFGKGLPKPGLYPPTPPSQDALQRLLSTGKGQCPTFLCAGLDPGRGQGLARAPWLPQRKRG